MVGVMERSPHAFKDMGEEDLRSQFLVQLNGHYEGQATGETFNYEGKTDILIRVGHRNIFIGECKFWKGQQALTKAIDQLLGYATWRDTKTALFVFNRLKNFSAVVIQIPEVVRSHPNFKRRCRTTLRLVFAAFCATATTLTESWSLQRSLFTCPSDSAIKELGHQVEDGRAELSWAARRVRIGHANHRPPPWGTTRTRPA